MIERWPRRLLHEIGRMPQLEDDRAQERKTVKFYYRHNDSSSNFFREAKNACHMG